jgi:hypothetical protein
MIFQIFRRWLGVHALFVCVCVAATLTLPAVMHAAPSQPSYDHPKFVELWRQATRPIGAAITEYPDFTLVKVNNGLILYYFTKPNHFAHPGIVVRTATRNFDGSWTHKINGASFAARRDDPGFLKWLEQFKELDRRMQQYIDETYGKPPTPARPSPPSPSARGR